MKQEEKQLLLVDLCARLPYGVFCDIYNEKCTITEKLLIGGLSHFCDDTIAVRPYLRPLSSMTEEEKEEYQKTLAWSGDIFTETTTGIWIPTVNSLDWLLKNHFDFRGLIDKGLAIEAPDGMYNKKGE